MFMELKNRYILSATVLGILFRDGDCPGETSVGALANRISPG